MAWGHNRSAGDKSPAAVRPPGPPLRPRRGPAPRQDSRRRHRQRRRLRNSPALRTSRLPRLPARNIRTRTPEHVPAQRQESSNQSPRSPRIPTTSSSCSWLVFPSVHSFDIHARPRERDASHRILIAGGAEKVRKATCLVRSTRCWGGSLLRPRGNFVRLTQYNDRWPASPDALRLEWNGPQTPVGAERCCVSPVVCTVLDRSVWPNRVPGTLSGSRCPSDRGVEFDVRT